MVYIYLITVVHNGTALPGSSKYGNSHGKSQENAELELPL